MLRFASAAVLLLLLTSTSQAAMVRHGPAGGTTVRGVGGVDRYHPAARVGVGAAVGTAVGVGIGAATGYYGGGYYSQPYYGGYGGGYYSQPNYGGGGYYQQNSCPCQRY